MADSGSISLRDMLRATKRITLQLSNLCPLAELHQAKCPAWENLQRDGRVVLPARVVKDVIKTLSKDNLGRDFEIAFHVYNEPLIDPRLSQFIILARTYLPYCRPVLCTNGVYLTEQLALDLVEAGMRKLVTSPYGPGERERLAQIGTAVKSAGCYYHPAAGALDSRLKYAENPLPDRRRRCWAPLKDLIILASGEIGLCCLDCHAVVRFNNVAQIGFAKAMEASYPCMLQLQRELRRGVRKLDVCKHCIKGR